MFTITKKFEFSASHQLDHLPEDHQCHRLHGHNYIVVLELYGTLDENGFVIDYGDLKPFKDIIDNELDHRHLNDLFDFPTTAECLAQYLYERAKEMWTQTKSVAVSETPKTWATYQP